MATFLRVDGLVQEVENATFKKVEQFIGGYVERINMPNGGGLYFDEDGKAKHLQINAIATTYGRYAGIGDEEYILGNAVYRTVEEEKLDL